MPSKKNNAKGSLLIFAAYFFPHEGGYEQYVYNEALGLTKKGYHVTIITANTENAASEEILDGIKVYRLPCYHLLGKTYPVLKPSAARHFLKQLMKTNHFDLINCHTRFFNTCLWALWFAKKTKRPLLHIEHGTRHSSLPRKWLEWAAILYDHTFGRKIIKRSWKVAGVAQAAEKFAKHLYNRETMTIFNAVDTTFFDRKDRKNENDHMKKTLGVDNNETVITFVSRLIYAKGAQDLIKQSEGLSKTKILIIGDGNYRNALEHMAGGRKEVIFLGKRDKSFIRDALAITDIFVSPSYSEGLPTNVLEAGAMGTAVIATDVGGTREIIDTPSCGMLYDPKHSEQLGTALRELIEHKEKGREMGVALQKSIRKKFSWEKTAEKIVVLIEDSKNL